MENAEENKRGLDQIMKELEEAEGTLVKKVRMLMDELELEESPKPQLELTPKNLKYKILRDQYYDLEDGIRLYRIQALRDIPSMYVKAGDFGGWIESEMNLSQEGTCWIADCAAVYESSIVKDDAFVGGKAEVSGTSMIMDESVVRGRAIVYCGVLKGDVDICDNAEVHDSVLDGDIDVRERATVVSSRLYGKIRVEGEAEIARCEEICGNKIVIGLNGTVYDDKYFMMGPIGSIKNAIIYPSDDGMAYSADDEIFDDPHDIIAYLREETGAMPKYLKDAFLKWRNDEWSTT